MSEKLLILNEMDKLAGIIKMIENDLNVIDQTEVKFADSIKIEYIIPDKDVRHALLATPGGNGAAEIIASIRGVFETRLRKYYELLDSYADKLKNAQ